MTIFLLALVSIPIFWLLGLLAYLLSWIDIDKDRAYVSK
jgi:ABC-type dipeptide/oligopeptide/nickel transport system permease component